MCAHYPPYTGSLHYICSCTHHVSIANVICLLMEEEEEEIETVLVGAFFTEVIIVAINEGNRS